MEGCGEPGAKFAKRQEEILGSIQRSAFLWADGGDELDDWKRQDLGAFRRVREGRWHGVWEGRCRDGRMAGGDGGAGLTCSIWGRMGV